MTDSQMDAPERIWVEYGQSGPEAMVWVGGSTIGLRKLPCYILATPEALAPSPEVQKLVADAKARVWQQVRLRDQRIAQLEARDGIILVKPDAALVAEAEARGMERAAKLVDKRAEDYDRDYGSYDYSTGVTEYPGTGSESMEEWESIATEIRAEAAAIRGETP